MAYKKYKMHQKVNVNSISEYLSIEIRIPRKMRLNLKCNFLFADLCNYDIILKYLKCSCMDNSNIWPHSEKLIFQQYDIHDVSKMQ